jgi:hypothetical protein
MMGEVTLAYGRRAVDVLKALVCILFRDAARNSGEFVGAYLGKRLCQVALQVPLLETKAKEYSQGSLYASAYTQSSILGVVCEEGQNLLRRHTGS